MSGADGEERTTSPAACARSVPRAEHMVARVEQPRRGAIGAAPAPVAFALWHPRGVRDDPEPLAGVAHLFEHLWLSDLGRESARIAEAIAASGAALNGETGAEHVACRAIALADGAPALLDALLVARDAVPEATDAAIDFERERIRAEHLLASARDGAMAALRSELFAGHALGRQVGRPPDRASSRAELRRALAALASTRPTLYTTDPETLPAWRGTAHPERPVRRAPLALRPCARILDDGASLVLLQALPAPGRDSPRRPTVENANLLLLDGGWSEAAVHLRCAAPYVYHARTWLEGYSDAGVWWLELHVERARSRETARALYGALSAAVEAAADPGVDARLERLVDVRGAIASSSPQGALSDAIRSDLARAHDTDRDRHGRGAEPVRRSLLRFLDATVDTGLRALARISHRSHARSLVP